MPRKPFIPQPGDVIWLHWVDINERTLSAPEEVQPDYRRTKEVFLGWRTCTFGGHEVEYLLCSRGDESLVTGEQFGGCAYPKGCILGITQYKSRKAGEGTVVLADAKHTGKTAK